MTEKLKYLLIFFFSVLGNNRNLNKVSHTIDYVYTEGMHQVNKLDTMAITLPLFINSELKANYLDSILKYQSKSNYITKMTKVSLSYRMGHEGLNAITSDTEEAMQFLPQF